MKAAVSSLGCFRDTCGIVKRPRPHKGGYAIVSISSKKLSLHRLVATAFLGPAPSRKHTVDHLNMDTGDNRKENLEWVTPKQQIQRSYKGNTQRLSSAFKKSKPIKGRKLGTQEWVLYESISAAARILQLDTGNVAFVAKGITRQTKGYEFVYNEPNEPEMLPGEEWKAVVGYPMYSISSLGRFRDQRGVTKTPRQEQNGYVRVQIGNKRVYLHRLIATTFLGPPPSPKHTVDHLNMDPGDNRKENLEWVTQAQQVQRSHEKNTGRHHSLAKSKPVKGRKVGTEVWICYESVNAAARVLKLYTAGVNSVLKGKHTHTGGYEFVYDEPREPDLLPGEEWRDVVV